ncbi:MAG: hypothetical protein RMI01_09675, partial [Thermodesulfovibrio sp.]|nr:hypothetical protein [Thermodesulfovibrio sp.]
IFLLFFFSKILKKKQFFLQKFKQFKSIAQSILVFFLGGVGVDVLDKVLELVREKKINILIYILV